MGGDSLAPGVDAAIKFTLIKFSAWVFIGLSSGVAMFAPLRPRNLLYGEAGYRAEKKMEFDTETKTYTFAELDELKLGENSKLLQGEEPR